MQLLDTIKHHILQLDEKTFFAYIGGFILGLLLVLGGLFYYYSQASEELVTEIQELNTERTKMRKLFETYAQVRKQEVTVDKLLKENENFRIYDQFTKILEKVIPNGSAIREKPTSELKGKYLEWTLTTNISMVDMKQICELLQAIEENPRLYTKELDITRSATAANKLDVRLAIGTLDLNTTPGT